MRGCACRGGNGFAHVSCLARQAEVAVEECAEDTAGQTCFICMEAVHSSTGEGLVRGCACRGGNGFVHVLCLALQAVTPAPRSTISARP